ncbi:hypothetical protein D3C76_1022430 [compost metagenome]
MTVTRGNDVAVAGKDMRLDEFEFAIFHDGRIRDDEQRIAKGFQLRAAVFFQGVFNGQLMQVELALQVVQLLFIRLFQADPDEVPRLRSPGRAFVEGYIGDFLTGAVNRSSNNSTHDVDSLLLGSVQLSLVCYRESVKSCRSPACRRRRPSSRWVYRLDVLHFQAACSCRSIESMHSRICSRHWAINMGMSSRLNPAVGMAGKERIRIFPLRQRFNRMCLT